MSNITDNCDDQFLLGHIPLFWPVNFLKQSIDKTINVIYVQLQKAFMHDKNSL